VKKFHHVEVDTKKIADKLKTWQWNLPLTAARFRGRADDSNQFN
jgi:hypothetical protein